MAGSLTLHWTERLSDDETAVIREIIERYEDGGDECCLHDELTTETELFAYEVERLVDDFVENLDE